MENDGFNFLDFFESEEGFIFLNHSEAIDSAPASNGAIQYDAIGAVGNDTADALDSAMVDCSLWSSMFEYGSSVFSEFEFPSMRGHESELVWEEHTPVFSPVSCGPHSCPAPIQASGYEIGPDSVSASSDPSSDRAQTSKRSSCQVTREREAGERRRKKKEDSIATKKIKQLKKEIEDIRKETREMEKKTKAYDTEYDEMKRKIIETFALAFETEMEVDQTIPSSKIKLQKQLPEFEMPKKEDKPSGMGRPRFQAMKIRERIDQLKEEELRLNQDTGSLDAGYEKVRKYLVGQHADQTIIQFMAYM